MLAADLARGAVVALLALLSLTGALELWHMVVLVAAYGAAQAFFDPAFDAIVPDVLPAEELAQANSLDQVVRPLAFRLAGPALGGVLIDLVGPGGAFALDAVTFTLSAVALLAMRARPRQAPAERVSVIRDLSEGFRYVRRHVWLWGTFACAAIAYLLFLGPTEVLLPFLVKEELGGSGTDLGLVLGAGGVGSIGCALAHGPARPAATRHHDHVLRLGGGHACRRGLRRGERDLAADARQPPVQRARDRRHDHLGDDQAAPRPGRACSAASRASTG